MDEEKANKELAGEEYKDFKKNSEIRAIIANKNAKTSEIDLGGIKIKVKSSIPKPLRDKILFVGKAYEAGNLAEGDKKMYEIMAEMCIDAPYTNPTAWAYIDKETGMVPEALKNVVESMVTTESAAKSFRKK